MSISLPISDEVEKALREQARDAGVSAETLAAQIVERSVRTIAELRAITAPMNEAFKASGMTEDELSELLEAEKHAMRAERKKKAS